MKKYEIYNPLTGNLLALSIKKFKNYNSLRATLFSFISFAPQAEGIQQQG